jgi:hypothetical protein
VLTPSKGSHLIYIHDSTRVVVPFLRGTVKPGSIGPRKLDDSRIGTRRASCGGGAVVKTGWPRMWPMSVNTTREPCRGPAAAGAGSAEAVGRAG